MRILLFPFSLLYGLIVFLRNLLYDTGVLSSQSFDVPVISVGNLSLGGTGKSVHTEYLIRLLHPYGSVATLSRGYGRNTSGFLLAPDEPQSSDIGDEPCQFKRKFREIPVAVDGNRVRGIRKLLEKFPLLDVILLDDAFQHRAVEPGLSILLTDYSKLYIADFLLPAGTLREWKGAAHRADIIVVTKTPEVLSPIDRRVITEQIKLKPHQRIYFSFITYGDFIPLHKKPGERKEANLRTEQQKTDLRETKTEPIAEKNSHDSLIGYGISHGFVGKDFYFTRNYYILLLTGIANSSHLYYYIKNHASGIQHIKYPDHYQYTEKDMKSVSEIFNNIAAQNKIILTTEKDAVRLHHPSLHEIIKDLPFFYIPIEATFHEKDSIDFNEQIISYVKKNQIHRRLSKKKN